MAMKFRKQMVACLLLVLATALLFPCGIASAAAFTAAEARASARDAAPALDYSNAASEATMELTASAFLALITDENDPISPLEANYLDSMLIERPFTYTTAIPPRQVSATFENGTLHVSAKTYTYTAANGETVTWIPTSVSLSERNLSERNLSAGSAVSYPLSPGADSNVYAYAITGISESTQATLLVQYTCTIEIPAAEADFYRNYTYRYASALHREQESYEALLTAYNAYHTYLQEKEAYDIAHAKWLVYVEEKAKYDQKFAEYQAYEQAMAAYREAQAAYEAYCAALKTYEQDELAYKNAYATYLSEKAAYDDARILYEQYQNELARIADVMAVFDSAFVRNSVGQQMYATLMGDTVASVVARKDQLITMAGCTAEVIDAAADATAVLQKRLTEYKALTGMPERFAYYTEHYAEIRDNFILLYASLRTLYDNKLVYQGLISEKRLERYIEFLGQLYVISSGMDDSQMRDNNWKVFGALKEDGSGRERHSFLTDLEPVQIPPDKNNADPTGITCPSVAVPEPTPPVLSMERPQKPNEIPRPTEPDAVLKPTAPAPMEQPVEPTPVKNPGEKPTAPSFTATQQALIEAIRQGTLACRPEGANRPITLSTSVAKPLARRLVEFYDYDGVTLLYQTELEYGSAITYPHAGPTRPTDEKNTYRFVGWKSEPDSAPSDNLGVVDEFYEVFYASYEATPRLYTVTWRVDGKETTSTLAYGKIPAYNGTPTRPATDQHSYTFSGWRTEGVEGWSRDLLAVRGDITYEAVFEETLRTYTITWAWGENRLDESYHYGTLPSFKRDPAIPEDERFLYHFIGWDAEPSAVVGDMVYTARYNAIPILSSDASDEPLPITLTDQTYTATLPATGGLRVDRLLSLAASRDRDIVMAAPGSSVHLSLKAAAITDLTTAGCVYMRVSPSTSPCTTTDFVVSFANEDGREISLQYPVSLSYELASAHTVAYLIAADGTATPLPLTYEAASGTATVRLTSGAHIRFVNEYTVTVPSIDNGMLTTDTARAAANATVQIALTHADDFMPDLLQVIGGLTGKTYPLLGEVTDTSGRAIYTFTMPDEPVTVEVSLKRRTFTVTFVVDGAVVATRTYHKGDTVIIPDDPTKEPNGSTVYTFTGWSPSVTSVNGDATYTAVFSTSVQGGANQYIPDHFRNHEYVVFIVAGLMLAVLIATPIVLVRLIKRHRKRTENPK